MLRRIPLPVVSLLVALVLAGCSSGEGGDGRDGAEGGGGENPVTSTGDPAVAATVNGTDIPVADVEAEFARLESNPQAQEQLANDPDGAARREAEASIVSQLISAQLLDQVAGELGVAVGEAEVQEARAGIIEQVGGEDAFNQIITEQGIAEEDLQRILEQTATQTAVGEALVADDAAVQTYFEQNADSFGGPSAQVRHILVEEEAVAQQALERIRGGEDFAAVASELSTDTGSAANGGDLGAVTPGQTVPEFDEAVFSGPVGELQGPVQTEFGFHVIEVTERSDEAPDLEAVREQLREDPSPLFGARLQEAGMAAEVVVNPRFGTWDPATGRVAPTDPLGEVAPPSEGAGAPPGGAPGAPPGGAPGQAPPTDASSE